MGERKHGTYQGWHSEHCIPNKAFDPSLLGEIMQVDFGVTCIGGDIPVHSVKRYGYIGPCLKMAENLCFWEESSVF